MSTEQTWEASALKNVSFDEIKDFTAVMLPMNPRWIGDGLGVYSLTEDSTGKEIQSLQVRKVWTVLVCDDRQCEFYPAVINKFGTKLFLLGIGKSKFDFQNKNYVVLSGSRKEGMANGKMIKIEADKLQKDASFRKKFFTENESEITEDMLVSMDPETPRGQKFIEDLRKNFPHEVVIDGKLVSSTADIKTLRKLVGMSNNATAAGRILDRAHVNLSVQTVVFPYLELVRIAIVASLAANDDTLKGSFFEARVTGAQAGEALSSYLKACQEENSRLQKENFLLWRKEKL